MKSWKLAPLTLIALATLAWPNVTSDGTPPFVFPDGCCFYEGDVVRTVVPPAENPQEGRDDFYAVANGAEGQKAIVAVAPGDDTYHGGQWKFHLVTWVDGATPTLLTSAEAVLDAVDAGLVTIERDAAKDFKCPIQP